MENISGTKRNTLAKVGVTVTLLVILGVGAWIGSTNFAGIPKNLNDMYASVISLTKTFKGAETLILEVPNLSVSSGQTITLSWKHENKSGEGEYVFTYGCTDGIVLELKETSGGKNATLACDEKLLLPNDATSASFIVTSKKNRYGSIPVTLTFIKNGSEENPLSASAMIMVANESLSNSRDGILGTTKASGTATKSATPTTPPKKTGAVAVKPAPVDPKAGTKTENTYLISGTTAGASETGKPDLAAKIIEVGVIDKITNEFMSTTTLHSTDRIAVRFEVINLGNKTSSDWYFNAVLPTFPNHIFTSDSQGALAPNDRIEFTLGFDKIENKNGNIFTINIDPTGYLPDVTRDNNIVKYTINGVIF